MIQTQGRLKSHCIYGADADLIMLGLSTHEPNFYVIRESLDNPREKFHEKLEEVSEIKTRFLIKFSLVRINVVREYLYSFTRDAKIKFPYNLESVLDDFVLLCFLVGNDFLPHLPGLDIRMGGIDLIMAFYKKTLPKLKGFLTNGNEISLENFEIFLRDLGRVEFELLCKIEYHQSENVSLEAPQEPGLQRKKAEIGLQLQSECLFPQWRPKLGKEISVGRE